jgi:hypothetical protein
MITEKEISKKEGLYKFVKVNDKYRFVGGTFGSHSELVDDGEKATSAGSIWISQKYWKLCTNYSSTLKVRCAFDEVEHLGKLFSVPFEPDDY